VRVDRSLAFSLGLLVASVIGLSWALQQTGGGAQLDEIVALPSWLGGPEREPVLVVVLGYPGSVSGPRAAIPRERIVAESPAAFAVRERRLVAESFDEVGPVLMAAGWRDAPLEIVALRRRAPVQRLTADPLDRVSELMNKPTLNLLEARAVLNTM